LSGKSHRWRFRGGDRISSGGNCRAKTLLQKKKKVSNKIAFIAAKEKTAWNTRREVSDKRRGDGYNGANPQHVPAKNNGDKEKSKK
jgi:hypothetical protein